MVMNNAKPQIYKVIIERKVIKNEKQSWLEKLVFLNEPFIQTDRRGIFYDTESHLREKMMTIFMVKKTTTSWIDNTFNVLDKKLIIKPVSDCSFVYLMNNLDHEEFVQYCKDNFNL